MTKKSADSVQRLFQRFSLASCKTSRGSGAYRTQSQRYAIGGEDSELAEESIFEINEMVN
jgi:hypothetical protein